MRILVTGANGHLGKRVVSRLTESHEVVAVVRSERALKSLSGIACDKKIIDYTDRDQLTTAALDCDCAVHLVGIIKLTRNNSYTQAHELPCTALAHAAEKAGLKQIVILGIIGSDAESSNGCFASRGIAEDILLKGAVPATILRVPMVLGEGDYASVSLQRKAGKKVIFNFRAASLEQPIYAGDVVNAICALVETPAQEQILELGGPESLTRAELIQRAGSIVGKEPIVISVPVVIGKWIGRAFAKVMSSPPVTEDMIDLLDHDDNIDAIPVAKKLGIELTPLDVMLGRVI